MRIVVSGTHASGKSTLVADFALRHPEFAVLPDPFEDVDEMWDSPNATSFAAQFRVSADRLHPFEQPENVIAERGSIEVGIDEHLELRDAMNDILLDLLGDSDLIGQRPKIAEITGDRDSRLAALEAGSGVRDEVNPMDRRERRQEAWRCPHITACS